MERGLDSSLRDLREQLLEMGGYVERMIEDATGALLQHDPGKLKAVHDYENLVNQSHLAVDEACIKLLALQQPLAADLRLIVAVLKINSDLERMGDQAVNIANNAKRYMEGPALSMKTGAGGAADLPQMSSETRVMVREALDSFVRVDQELARAVLVYDDKVDALKNKIFRDVLEHIKKESGEVEQGLNMILIARNLERIGDHATNIAEDVIYAVSGEDVRHSMRAETIKGVL